MTEQLRWSNAVQWLKNTLRQNGNELYFGSLTANLHSALVEDPKPYRSDVKALLGNLLSLIDQWNLAEIVIDRPNYSQRVRLIE